MSTAGVAGAFSVTQCVAKRARQLERLLYMLESTAAKFKQVKSPPSCSDSAVLSTNTKIQVQKRYGKLLLDFLEKERGLQISALLADAIHLESYDEELQQLLVLVGDEELLRQRVHGTWDFLDAASMDHDVAALVRTCECSWNDLLPQISSASPLINSIRGNPDLPSWMKSTETSCSAVHPWPTAAQRSTGN